MQRDVEDVAARPAEPGGQAAQLVVLLEQQHLVAGAAQHVGGGQSGQAAADDDHVVTRLDVLQKIFRHGSASFASGRRPASGDWPPGSR